MSSNSSNIVIAVMGMTGAGKSSFISSVSGRKDIVIGHKISSATEYVTPYEFQYAGTNFTLVDTPGFDDSRHTDDIIANRLLEWLRQSMTEGKKLNGIIYLHRIIDPRMQGTALSNMNMFRRLCGSDCFPNVVLATSFWSEVDPTEGAQRERELCETDEFWGQLVKKGSRVVRIGLDDRADQRLLLRIAQNKKVVFQAQQEMQDGKRNCETSAAQEANRNLTLLRQHFTAQLEAEGYKLRQEFEELEKRREEQLKAQRTRFEEDRRAQKQAHQKYEADNAVMKREEEKSVSHQARLKQLREARQVENERLALATLKQERQKVYNEHKCKRAGKRLQLTCNHCGTTIKAKTIFYHCCHCRKDNFDLCMRCGSRRDSKCERSDHPPMKLCGGG